MGLRRREARVGEEMVRDRCRALPGALLDGQDVRANEGRLLAREEVRAVSELSEEQRQFVGRLGGMSLGRDDIKTSWCQALGACRSLVRLMARRIRLSMLISSYR